MVADRVDVTSRAAGQTEAWTWSSDGKRAYAIEPTPKAEAPERGTRIRLYLMEDAKSYASKWTIDRIIKEQSGHVAVPISVKETVEAEPVAITDGAAL